MRDTIYVLYATGRVDPTYKHIWGFKSREQRASFLQSKKTNVILNNKYWRVGNTIKVNVSYEDSFEYDYAIITNNSSDANKRDWYCFITSRLYISNNVTQLTLDVDIVQTYYFNVESDGELPFWNTYGYITKITTEKEPVRGTASDYVPSSRSVEGITYQENNYYVVIYSTVDLRKDDIAYTVSQVDGVIMSASPYIIIGSNNADTLSRYATLIDKINNNGWTSAIQNVCVIPAIFVQTKTTGVYLLTEIGTQDNTIVINKPSTYSGYTPVHNILCGQDYCYVVVNNNLGEEIKYRFDDFKNNRITLVTGATYNSGTVELYCYPANHKDYDISSYRLYAQKMTSVPLCGYDNDTYKIWLAQTVNSRQTSLNNAYNEIKYSENQRNASMSYNLQKAVAPVLNTITDYITTGLNNAGGAIKEQDTSTDFRQTLQSALKNKYNPYNTQQMGGVNYNKLGDYISSLSGLAVSYIYKQAGFENNINYDINVYRAQDSLNALQASYQDKSLIPSTPAGSNAYGSLTKFNQVGFTVCLVTPSAESAEQLDKLISASGITYNRDETFIQQHKIFDYIAINSADIPVDVEHRPQYARNLLLSILDSGIYLWYYVNGDINRHYGTPFGVENEVIE